MVVNVVVNGKKVAAPLGSTLAECARLAKIHVPTLCYSPRYPAKQVCRLCLVEVAGRGGGKPLAACSTKANNGDVVTTDSEALKAFRRFDVELLLARHPNACMRCEVNGECKLQDLVQEDEVEDRWPKVVRGDLRVAPSHRPRLAHLTKDHSSPAIDRDISKCVECGLCVSACATQRMDVIGFVERSESMVPTSIFDRPLAETDCISCGQCTLACPVGALTERPDWHRVLHVLDSGRRTTVVQTAPATRVTIGELFGLGPGSVSTGRMISALRALGFNYVFDTNMAADLTIMEEAYELLARIRGERDAPLPMFTSCCPGWVNYVELKRPDLLPHLSTSKSPQQMHAAVTKNIFGPTQLHRGGGGGGTTSLKDDDAYEPPFVVSIMPCTAKKDEAVRPDLYSDVDAVLTTRELARMIRHRKINFASLPNDATYDSPLGESSGAASIFGASGGVLEAALRTAAHALGKEDKNGVAMEYKTLRGVSANDCIKVATVPGLGAVAAVNSMGAAVDFLKGDAWRDYLMIEVMACLGGCLGGGGEPKSDDPLILEKRAAAIYGEDKRKAKRASYQNAEVHSVYEYLGGKPLSHTAERLLHTTYAPRRSPREVLGKFLSAMDRHDGGFAAELFTDAGIWQTGTAQYGTVVGKEAIRELVDTRIPLSIQAQCERLPPPHRELCIVRRHRFVHPSEGFLVERPDGVEALFDIHLDPDTGKIAFLKADHATTRPKFPLPNALLRRLRE